MWHAVQPDTIDTERELVRGLEREGGTLFRIETARMNDRGRE
jgi:Holliday junction resolvase